MLNLIQNIFYRKINKGELLYPMVVQPHYSGIIKYDEFKDFLNKNNNTLKKEKLQDKLVKLESKNMVDTTIVKFLICEFCELGDL